MSVLPRLREHLPRDVGIAGRASQGVTVLELTIAMAILALTASIAVPIYHAYVYEGQLAKAMSDIRTIGLTVESFQLDARRHPSHLDEVGMGSLRDPWGNPYQYLNIADAPVESTGKQRRDKSLVPVNSDYDLYSMGRDGRSRPPFTAASSYDDIVRCNNGGFVGLASDY